MTKHRDHELPTDIAVWDTTWPQRLDQLSQLIFKFEQVWFEFVELHIANAEIKLVQQGDNLLGTLNVVLLASFIHCRLYSFSHGLEARVQFTFTHLHILERLLVLRFGLLHFLQRKCVWRAAPEIKVEIQTKWKKRCVLTFFALPPLGNERMRRVSPGFLPRSTRVSEPPGFL